MNIPKRHLNPLTTLACLAIVAACSTTMSSASKSSVATQSASDASSDAAPVDARLRVWLDQIAIADGPVHLEAGETHLNFPQPVGAPGIDTVRAELQVGQQASTLSSVLIAFVTVTWLSLMFHVATSRTGPSERLTAA